MSVLHKDSGEELPEGTTADAPQSGLSQTGLLTPDLTPKPASSEDEKYDKVSEDRQAADAPAVKTEASISNDTEAKTESGENDPGQDDLDKSSRRKALVEMATKVFEKVIDDESDDSDIESALKSQVEDVAYPNFLRPLEKRREKAERRLYQNILYQTLVDDRLRSLENSMRKLEGLPEKPVEKSKPKEVQYKPGIVYLTLSEFRRKIPKKKTSDGKRSLDNTGSYNVLEVLVEDPHNAASYAQASYDEAHDPTRLNKEYERPVSDMDTSRSTNEMEDKTPRRVRIRSPLLVKILSEVTNISSLGGADKATITLIQPFKVLFAKAAGLKSILKKLEHKHSSSKATAESLQDRGSEPGDSLVNTSDETGQDQDEVPATETYEALEHLRVLVKFMDVDLKPLWDLRKQAEQGTLKKIAFRNLWHLFKHGQDIRKADPTNLQVFRVKAFTGGRDLINWEGDPPENWHAKTLQDYSPGSFIIHCYNIDFNGSRYGPKDTLFMIRRYEGEKDILGLTCYPLLFEPNGEQIRKEILLRSEKFIKFSTPTITPYCHQEYDGLTVDHQQEQVDSQVIMDVRWAFLKNPSWKFELGFNITLTHDNREVAMPRSDLDPECQTQGCCGNDWFMSDYAIDKEAGSKFERDHSRSLELVDHAQDLHEDHKILLPYRAFGFVLRSRKWAALSLDLLKEVRYQDDGWSDLQLPDGHKETVLALVRNHRSAAKSTSADVIGNMDLVRGKGKGLIILLHGAPGVGKTSTAECVADHTKRPLFAITCGDIGETAEKVEASLESSFQLAHRWGCVLLLDEADVFLHKRTKVDLVQNSIVSVFLRTLEYYSGILFLTTNRVGSIDPAFKSRIHLSLHYPVLSRKVTVTIWTSHLSRLRKQFKKEGRKFEIDKKDILAYARQHFKDLEQQGRERWNGRQIRNAFQTAVALAEYQTNQVNKTPRLTSEQFKKVAAASQEFDNYLKNVWGGRDESELARQDQVRIDSAMHAHVSPNSTALQRYVPTRHQRVTQAGSTSSRASVQRSSYKAHPPQPQHEESESDDESDDDGSETETDDGFENEMEQGSGSESEEEEDVAEEEEVEEGERQPPENPDKARRKSKAAIEATVGSAPKTKKKSKSSKA